MAPVPAWRGARTCGTDCSTWRSSGDDGRGDKSRGGRGGADCRRALAGRFGLFAAAPGLARIAAGAAWRTTAWSAAMYVRTGRSILRAATSGESAAELLQRAEAELRRLRARAAGRCWRRRSTRGARTASAANGRDEAGRGSPTRRSGCASWAPSSCASPPTSMGTTSTTPPTPASSRRSPPTRPGSCA